MRAPLPRPPMPRADRCVVERILIAIINAIALSVLTFCHPLPAPIH